MTYINIEVPPNGLSIVNHAEGPGQDDQQYWVPPLTRADHEKGPGAVIAGASRKPTRLG